jgi:hypothetical protein
MQIEQCQLNKKPSPILSLSDILLSLLDSISIFHEVNIFLIHIYLPFNPFYLPFRKILLQPLRLLTPAEMVPFATPVIDEAILNMVKNNNLHMTPMLLDYSGRCQDFE